MKNRYELNQNNELISNDSGTYTAESFVETYENLTDLYFQGIPRYYLKNDQILKRTDEELQELEEYKNFIFNTETVDELDKFINDGYKTFGKSLVGIMLQRFFEIFSQQGEMTYNNELQTKSTFEPELNINFGYSDKDLKLFNDTGFIYVEDITKDAELILNTKLLKNKLVIGALSMVVEAGYLPEDIEIAFLQGEGEETVITPLSPFNKSPYSVFGYAELPSENEVKLYIKLKAGNAHQRAIFDNIIIVSD